MDEYFGHQCDALTKSGGRCCRTNQAYIPCEAVYDASVTSFRSDKYQPVRLCRQHSYMEAKCHSNKTRFPLRDGGWLGPFNEGGGGNLVIDTPTVDWDNFQGFTIPEKWK